MEKNKILLMTILIAGILLFVPQAVFSSGETAVNCSYHLSSPSDGTTIQENGTWDGVSGTWGTFNPDNGWSLRIDAYGNLNHTNSVATTLNWDGTSTIYGAATDDNNTQVTFNNQTGTTNVTAIIGNTTDGTHSYYIEIAYVNSTTSGNISCQSGFTCAQYEVDDATYPNMTLVRCPTRTINVDYKTYGVPPALTDGDDDTTKERNNLFVFAIVIIVAVVAIRKYNK